MFMGPELSEFLQCYFSYWGQYNLLWLYREIGQVIWKMFNIQEILFDRVGNMMLVQNFDSINFSIAFVQDPDRI